MKKALILLFGIFLTSCSNDGESKRSPKTIYWEEQVAAINTKKLQLKDVLKEYAAFNPKHDLVTNTITFTEHVALESLVCKSWQYTITVKGNHLDYVESASLSETGVCL